MDIKAFVNIVITLTSSVRLEKVLLLLPIIDSQKMSTGKKLNLSHKSVAKLGSRASVLDSR